MIYTEELPAGENPRDTAGDPRGTVSEGTRRRGAAYTAAMTASVVLHPFIVPVYAILIFIYGNTMLAFASPKAKLFLLAVVILNALVIPMLSIALLRVLGMISDLSFKNRYDRMIPLAIAAICYLMCLSLISDLVFGFMIRKFFIAAFLCTVSALIITPFWRISLHMIAAGGVTAMFAIFTFLGMGSVFIPLMTGILLSGALGSARLYLGKHTPAQVAVGFFTGFAITAAVLFLLK